MVVKHADCPKPDVACDLNRILPTLGVELPVTALPRLLVPPRTIFAVH